jgi:predicted lipoprotein with Yx(FWY)xxD motif
MGTRSTALRIAVLVGLAAAVAVVAAGPGVAGALHVTKAKPTVQTRKVKKLGTVLVNKKGLTLYMFVRDKQKKVTCTSAPCTLVWPPLKIKKGQKPTAGWKARKKLLGVDRSPKGYRVVTYKRWPLYTYYLDKKPGQDFGQGVNQSGGKWYVLSPSGKVIKKHR